MVELIVRLCVAVGFLALGAFGIAPADVSWKAAAALAAISLFGWRLETKDLKNSGIAGFFAIGEGLILALFLAGSGLLHELGFLVLIPPIYAALRFSSPMISMAPLAASSIVAADCLFSKSGMPSPVTLCNAAGVLIVSLLLGLRRTPTSEPFVAQVEAAYQPQVIEDGLLQLRENYRKLRDAYTELERKSRKDKISGRIAQAHEAEDDKFYPQLCAALCDLAHAEELAIYTLAQFESVMVVRGVSASFPSELQDQSVEVDVTKAPVLIREKAEAALAALTTGSRVANVLLTHKGKMVGMVCAIETHRIKLEEIRRNLTEAAPAAAKAIVLEMEREARNRRVGELEVLYEISSVSAGADTPATLAARVTREIKQSLKLDNVRIAFVEKGKEKMIANEGSKARLLDCMTFDQGRGVGGWVKAGSPEIVLFDARQDKRCDPEETLKRRIGSFVLIPLWVGEESVGYLTAATQVTGGIDQDQIGTLRLVGAEVCRALERLSGSKPGGLMTPLEFAAETAGREGTLVYLEPLRREQTIVAHGYGPYEEAIRKLSHQVRAKLPNGCCLCRRNQGDFLVFLDTDEEFARNWANEVTATASFIAISSSDPAKRVPLALRAKVATVSTQSHQLSMEIPA